ncbi:MAG: tail fiber domain-containing protein [Ignavibacteriales bacterium]|nr:tail fiber domain-containing protein [Ignavibacteriales bacterium]
MNIKEYSNALNVLSNIGIKKYERISNPGIEEIGVIAQELQKVYPQAVSGSPDSDVKTDPMMVDYSKLTPLLVKAVQEQQETIKKKLEDKLSKIESLLERKRFTTVSN